MVAALCFVATVGIAWALDWQAGDLMWASYVSSLTFGYLYGVVLIVASPKEVDAAEGWARPGRMGVLLAFFSAHFLLLHLFQGIVLTVVFPISAGPWGFLPAALSAYWLVAVATAVARFEELRAATRPSTDTVRMLRPYVSIASMQVLIFVFLIMAEIGILRFALYPALALQFFAPSVGRRLQSLGDRSI